MPWYRAGSVAVTNGSATVTGAGTDFVGNTQAGEVFLGPDGRVYEISAVQSATQLTIIPTYQGASAGGQAYGIQPTASFARDLAILAAQMLNTFGAVRDGPGQGLFADGTQAAPAIRFAADQDTGLRRVAPNVLAIVTGGQDRLWIDAAGRLQCGTQGNGDYGLSCHTLANGVSENDRILNVTGINHGSFQAFSAGSGNWNAAASAMKIALNSSTGRSINAGGTINTNGADYAEYMFKAAGCGTIAKGDVCGVNRDGELTKTWAEAISFVLKSTDPSYVGADTWASHLPARPEQSEDEANTLFASRLAAWDKDFEAARQCVDRIAFCGQVPCNVTGDFDVGDYIIAAANGAGIKAVAVKSDEITLPQYMRRIGKVWAIRDGRAWIDVQHG